MTLTSTQLHWAHKINALELAGFTVLADALRAQYFTPQGGMSGSLMGPAPAAGHQ